MWAVILFVVSLVLLGAFAVLHSWEAKRGGRFFEKTRMVSDVHILNFYRALVSGNIPTEWRTAVLAFLHQVTHAVVVFLVEVLRAAERPLAQLSHHLHTHAPSGNGKEVSLFLKTLSPVPTPKTDRDSDLSDTSESVGKKSGNGTTPESEV